MKISQKLMKAYSPKKCKILPILAPKKCNKILVLAPKKCNKILVLAPKKCYFYKHGTVCDSGTEKMERKS